ncbi:MAG: AAA family ATPase [Nocardioides sp.]
MSITLAVANQKGGVAKTTTVASVGAALGDLGQRVLLVDLDPQACLTFSLGVDPEDLDVSLHQVLTAGLPAREVIVETEDGVDLLPATIELARAEADLLTRTGREQVLGAALADLAEDGGPTYDWVLLDCPPSLGVLTVAALTAARAVLILLQCETLSHRGVGQLLDTVHDVRRFTNRGLEVWGVLPTLYDGRTNHARRVLETISTPTSSTWSSHRSPRRSGSPRRPRPGAPSCGPAAAARVPRPTERSPRRCWPAPDADRGERRGARADRGPAPARAVAAAALRAAGAGGRVRGGDHGVRTGWRRAGAGPHRHQLAARGGRRGSGRAGAGGVPAGEPAGRRSGERDGGRRGDNIPRHVGPGRPR